MAARPDSEPPTPVRFPPNEQLDLFLQLFPHTSDQDIRLEYNWEHKSWRLLKPSVGQAIMRFTHKLLTFVATVAFAIYFVRNIFQAQVITNTGLNNSPLNQLPDFVDTFQDYNYRNHSKCQISSLDLHTPFLPLCSTRDEMLAAISGGGRIGFEAPFLPRGCDMRWFTTEQVCEIASRFSAIIFVGDSMMRHVVGAMNVLLRKDLGYGAVTNWNFKDEEFRDCFCNHQFDVKDCSLQGIYSTADVLKNDPSSLACSSKVNVVTEMMLKFPLVEEEVLRFKELLAHKKPKKPYAFVFGHGLWNDLDIQATVNWLDGIYDNAIYKASYLEKNLFPRLFISPNAAGILKPDQWILSQGDKALQLFEHATRQQAKLRGVDHLGTWNMSIQADKYDGVHLDLKGNLIKAMAMINWLSMIETGKW